MGLTAEQLALRKTGIGASEIGAIAGLNPFKGPLDVWARKLGLVEDDAGEAADWGNRLEPVIAAAYAEREGVELAECGTLQAPDEPWMLATPDRIILPTPADALLEIKAPGLRQAHRWGEQGSDEIPEEYLAQAQWQMEVTRRAKGWLVECVHFAVLLGGQELRRYSVAYDPELAGSLVEIGREFWERCVLGGEQPTVEGAADSARILAARFPRNLRPLVKVEGEARGMVARLFEARRAREAAEKEEEAAAAAVKALIADAEGLTCDLGKVTWKCNKDSQKTDWEAVAADLAKRLDPAVVEAARREFTTIKPGARVFRVAPAKEGK